MRGEACKKRHGRLKIDSSDLYDSQNMYLEISVDTAELSRYWHTMIECRQKLQTLKNLLLRHPVVGIIGARPGR